MSFSDLITGKIKMGEQKIERLDFLIATVFLLILVVLALRVVILSTLEFFNQSKYTPTLHISGKRPPINEDLIFMKNAAHKTTLVKGKKILKKDEQPVGKDKPGEVAYECEICAQRLILRDNAI